MPHLTLSGIAISALRAAPVAGRSAVTTPPALRGSFCSRAAGRSAVASLLGRRSAAVAAVDAQFHPRERPAAGRASRATGLRLAAGSRARTARKWSSAAATTQRVEIHCHGGHAAAAAIIASLVERWLPGSRLAGLGPRVRSQTRIASAARIALAAAPTERTAADLVGSVRGALERAGALAAEIASGNSGGRSAALARV